MRKNFHVCVGENCNFTGAECNEISLLCCVRFLRRRFSFSCAVWLSLCRTLCLPASVLIQLLSGGILSVCSCLRRLLVGFSLSNCFPATNSRAYCHRCVTPKLLLTPCSLNFGIFSYTKPPPPRSLTLFPRRN